MDLITLQTGIFQHVWIFTLAFPILLDMGAIALKVAVQMATKMGAEPWSVPIPATGVMVVGYDSYHDTADKSKSIGCIISTINQRLTRYNRQERDQN